MSGCTTNSIISTLSSIFAIDCQTEIKGRVTGILPASEARLWTKNAVKAIPPLPVTINLVFEPNISTASHCDVCVPSCVKVLLNHCISGIHISLSRNWHSRRHLPAVNVLSWLGLSAGETEIDGLWESGRCQIGNSNSGGYPILEWDSSSNLPRAGRWSGSWFHKVKLTRYIQNVAVVLSQH